MTLRRTPCCLALIGAASLALGLVACSDDDSGGSDNGRVIDAMVAEGATEEEARCVAGKLGKDTERLISASDDDLSEDDQVRVLDALAACTADASDDE